jgi:nucleoside-diphosphate-sugar epimerase
VRVLVTGHHGYMGSVLVRALTDSGHRVTGLDTFFYRGCDFAPSAADADELLLDVRDVTPEWLAGHDAVVHLAALSNDPLGNLNPELTLEINFRGTMRLAEAAREAGVRRFLFASSCSMYGASSDELVPETAPLAPLTPYAESKARAEEGLSALAGDGFSPVYLRNATVYGASPRLRLDLVLNNLVGWAYTTGVVKILSDGTPWRPLVHVEDVAGAILVFLEAPRDAVHDEAFNVGSDEENYQVRELGEIVRETVAWSTVDYGGGSGDPDPRSYRVDFAKLRRALPHFAPRWSAAAGARELLDAYDAAALTFDEFQGERFTRVKRLDKLLRDGALGDDLRWRGDPVRA